MKNEDISNNNYGFREIIWDNRNRVRESLQGINKWQRCRKMDTGQSEKWDKKYRIIRETRRWIRQRQRHTVKRKMDQYGMVPDETVHLGNLPHPRLEHGVT